MDKVYERQFDYFSEWRILVIIDMGGGG